MLNSLASSYILLFAIHPPISLGITQNNFVILMRMHHAIRLCCNNLEYTWYSFVSTGKISNLYFV